MPNHPTTIASMNLPKTLILILSLQALLFAKIINVDNITTQAKQQNKQVLIFFHMTNCGACKKMIRLSLNDKKIIQQIDKDFIYLDLNINDDDNIIYKDFKGSIHKFARSLDIHLYPSTIFIGKDDEVKYHLVGYRDKEKFSTVIEYVSTMSYNKMTLDSFIDEKDFNE